MTKWIGLSLLLLGFQSLMAESFLIRERISKDGNITTLAVEPTKKEVQQEVVLKNIQEFLSEHETSYEYNRDFYRERLVPENMLKPEHYYFLQNFDVSFLDLPHLEVRTIVEQGPVDNRINLPILAEGYTLAEKEKFFEDCKRISRDLFANKAFSSYLELFNVYAIFVASNESGVTDIQRKDTAFDLYRSPAGSKRGIIPGSSWAIDRAFRQAPGADYPIILVNDDYYGGLGGRYAITTRSLNSGSMVLRHELGHNFGNVGEEYDGGQVYSGANFSSSRNLNWPQWIEGQAKIFESKFLSGAYLWKNLNEGDIHVDIDFPGPSYIFDAKISSVGWDSPNDVRVELNGGPFPIKGVWTEDRSFFKPVNYYALNKGKNRFSFKENIHDGNNVFAFAMIYAHPRDIITSKHHVGGYSVFDNYQRKRGYRPTFDTCLMRDMRSNQFCSVDQENMWKRFLSKVSILDEYKVTKKRNGQYLVQVNAALNRHGKISMQGIDENNKVVFTEKFMNQFIVPDTIKEVRFSFSTSEVRKYDSNFVKSIRIQ
ncbi:MAG: M64 family metallopeptidase [Bdellovibrionota bacterium]